MSSRVALVTGGTRGIGASICERLRDRGYRVVASYGGNRAVAEAFSERTDIPVYQFDVSDFDACLDFSPLNVARMPLENWREVIRTNLGSCFNLCRNVIEGMRERRFGRIVNIGSINGQAGQYGQVNYAAAKSGIHGFTKALAMEGAAHGITVNAIAPGYIATDMVTAIPERVLQKIVAGIPVGRLGEADEIARGVEFLVADEAAFITGSTLSINGGQHMY